MTIAVLPSAPVAGIRSQFMPDAPVGRLPKPPSALWNGFMVVVNYLYEVIAKVAIPVILGVLAHFFLPAAAPACFAAAIAVATTRLVVKILDRYDLECLDNLKHNVSTFMNRFYWLQLVAFISSIALSLLHPIVGCVVSSAVGIVAGFLIGVEKTKHEQIRSREAVKEVKPPNIQAAYV